MSDSKLTRVVLAVELADGTEHNVTVTNPDLIRWDLTAPRRGWPAGNVAPFLLNTFLAFAAMKRLQLIPAGMDFDAFAEGDGETPAMCVQVSDAPTSGEPVPPTP